MQLGLREHTLRGKALEGCGKEYLEEELGREATFVM